MLLNSKRVKIDGLGIFYTTLENEKGGADKVEDFNVQKNLRALHIRFIPEQEQELNISSREFIKKAEFVNVSSMKGAKKESDSGESYVIDQPSNGGAPTGGEAPGEGD